MNCIACGKEVPRGPFCARHMDDALPCVVSGCSNRVRGTNRHWVCHDHYSYRTDMNLHEALRSTDPLWRNALPWARRQVRDRLATSLDLDPAAAREPDQIDYPSVRRHLLAGRFDAARAEVLR